MGNDNFPIWAPDGKQVIWTSSRPESMSFTGTTRGC